MKRMVSVAVLAATLVFALPGSAPASAGVLKASPETVNFGTKRVGTFTLKGSTVTNASDQTVNLIVTVVRSWDDFQFGLLPGSTCPVLAPEPLAAGESCKVVVGFRPTELFVGIKQDEVLLATATDPSTGEQVDSLEVVFLGTGR